MSYRIRTFNEADHELVRSFLVEQDVAIVGEGKPVRPGVGEWSLHLGDHQRPELICFLERLQMLQPPVIFLRHRIHSVR